MITRSTVPIVSPAPLRSFSIILKSISQQYVCTKTESTPQSQYQIRTNTNTDTNTNTHTQNTNTKYTIYNTKFNHSTVCGQKQNRHLAIAPPVLKYHAIESKVIKQQNSIWCHHARPCKMPCKVPCKVLSKVSNKVSC